MENQYNNQKENKIMSISFDNFKPSKLIKTDPTEYLKNDDMHKCFSC